MNEQSTDFCKFPWKDSNRFDRCYFRVSSQTMLAEKRRKTVRNSCFARVFVRQCTNERCIDLINCSLFSPFTFRLNSILACIAMVIEHQWSLWKPSLFTQYRSKWHIRSASDLRLRYHSSPCNEWATSGSTSRSLPATTWTDSSSGKWHHWTSPTDDTDWFCSTRPGEFLFKSIC